MTDIAEAYVSLVPSFRGGAGRIERALGNSPDRAGESTGRRFSNGFGAVVGRLGSIAAIAGVSIGVGKTLSAGLARITTIQDATVSLKTILGSQAKAAEFTDRILKTVQGTPFNLDQFLNAGKNLVAFGLDAQKVPGILTAIGDAAAASGKGAAGVDQLATVFGQITAKGKLQGDELLQLAQAGIPALAIMANKFGVSTAEMQKMISAGAVPATKAIGALADGIENGTKGIAGVTPKFGGQMAALRGTFNGALGGFKASIARLGASILTPLLGPATRGLSAFAGLFDKAGATIKAVFADVAPKVIAAAKNLWATFEPVAKLVGGALVAAFGGLVTAARALLNAVGPVTRWARENKTLVQALTVAIGAGVAVWGAWRLGILAWSAVTRVAAAVQGAFNAVMAANPIMLVVIAVAALAAGLIYAYKHSETFRQIVTAAWDGIKTAALFVWDKILKPIFAVWKLELQAVGAVVSWLWRNVVQPVASAIGTAFRAVFDGLKWAYDHVLAPAIFAFKTAWSAFSGWVSTAVDKVGGFFAGIWDGMKAAGVAVFNFIARIWNNTLGKIHFTIPPWVPGFGGKSFGFPTINEISTSPTGNNYRNASGASTGGTGGIRGYAKGGIIPARPGGTLIRVAEAGVAEAVTPLDGNHALPGGPRISFDGWTVSDTDPEVIAHQVMRRLRLAI